MNMYKTAYRMVKTAQQPAVQANTPSPGYRAFIERNSDWGAAGNTLTDKMLGKTQGRQVRRYMAPLKAGFGIYSAIPGNGAVLAGTKLANKAVDMYNKYNSMSGMEKFWKFKVQPWLKDNWHMLAIPVLGLLGGMALAGKGNRALGGVLGAGLGLALKDQAKGWLNLYGAPVGTPRPKPKPQP